MIVDGKLIASRIEKKVVQALREFPEPPALAILAVGVNPVIASFVRIKKTVAERLKIPVVERFFDETISTENLKAQIALLAQEPRISGIIVQLPLPSHLNTQEILDSIPINKDVDMLSSAAVALFAKGEATILPPITGAIQEILEQENISVRGVDVLVLGYGRLVGRPASIFLRHNDAHVTVIDQQVADLAAHTREAKLIVSGVGKPGLITPSMLAPDVILIDAGTSEAGGKIIGDVDPECAPLARVFTPVPGGVGPIAVAMIFKNLLILARVAKERMPHV